MAQLNKNVAHARHWTAAILTLRHLGTFARPIPSDEAHQSDMLLTNGKASGNMSDVAEQVKKIVVEHLGVDAAKVTENASFVDDLGADSLDTVELVMAFEEAFNVEIPDDAAEKIATVKDAIDYINTKKAA